MEIKPLPASIVRAPVSMVFRFPDPVAGNVAAYAMASAIQPEFVLFEVRNSSSTIAPTDLPWSELVPADRHLVIWAPDPTGRALPNGLPPWTVTRWDREDRALTTLVDIMTAPEASQKIIGHLLPAARPLPILVANGGQVAQVFPDDPSITSHLIALQKQLQYSTITTSDSRVRRDHVVFDYLFDGQLGGRDPGSIRLRCARAPWGEEWKRGDEFALDSVAEFSPALDRLRRTRFSWERTELDTFEPGEVWKPNDSHVGPVDAVRPAQTPGESSASRLLPG